MFRQAPRLTATILIPSFSNYVPNLDVIEPTFQKFLAFTAELSERDCWVYLSCPKAQQSAVINAFSTFAVLFAYRSHAQKRSFQYSTTCLYVLAPKSTFLENRNRILELTTNLDELEPAIIYSLNTLQFSIVDWNILAICFALRNAAEEGASPFSRDKHRHALTLTRLVKMHPHFACLQEVDKFSQFWRAKLTLCGYKFLYGRRAPRRDGLCIVYSNAYTCERSFEVSYNELMKENDKLAKDLIGKLSDQFNDVFEPDEALKQRAQIVQDVEIPSPRKFEEKTNYLCQNKSALIGIFRHRESLRCDSR